MNPYQIIRDSLTTTMEMATARRSQLQIWLANKRYSKRQMATRQPVIPARLVENSD